MVQIIIFVYLVNFFYLFKFLAYLNLNKIFKNRNRFKHKVKISIKWNTLLIFLERIVKLKKYERKERNRMRVFKVSD